ncbi:MAG: coenzyme F420-0:L-glutamate ligase [Nitrososphaerota archaeon]|jgi:coenzyme F420-0:L-glutamate ligase/coenzyme F420-1:gamma-L-glutamate ligase|nr:coenzyme F420-0:L-glutamate ligase [Nitrososphaerota archaeon]
MNSVQVIAIEGLPLSKKDDNIGQLLVSATKKQGIQLQERDIIVVTHVFVSKAEGNVVNLDTIKPSERAFEIAKQTNKDPALVEVILQEAKEIVKIGSNSIITETKSGTISANSGVDRSNVLGERNVVPLPKDPNKSAHNIRTEIKQLTGVNVAVIISDTHGRPFRIGEINVAIGVAGIKPIRDRRGEKDLFGYTLRIKQTAIADELASTAELVIGQASEGIPAAIIRGYTAYQVDENIATDKLIRSKEKDLFR